jgi:ParB family chromosome partitioning protein
MNIKPLYREIPLDQIDPADLTFHLAPGENEEISARLRASISRCGIIHPPILKAKGSDTGFTIVTGRKWIMAIRQILDADYCGCLLMPADTPAQDLLAMALQEILLTRPATPIEKAICWQKWAALLGHDRALAEYGPLLELSGQLTPARLGKILSLGHETQKALHNGALELKICLKLLDMKQPDREALFGIIAQLRLSSSNQRKLVDLCRELAKRRALSIAAVLAEPEFLEIINQPDANPPQQTVMLMNRLAGLCYPRLTEAKQDFQGFVNKLALPKGVAIEHATSFEKDSLKMTIEFTERNQLAERWPAIRQAISADKIEK